MEVSGQPHVPAFLRPWTRPRYSLDRRLGGPQNLSGRGGDKNKFPSLHLTEIEIRPSSLTLASELLRLLGEIKEAAK